jgi:hypothetical protein
MSHTRLRVRGKAEIKALADQVFSALQEAELPDELGLLHERVFSCEPDVLFDTTFDNDESVWTFKPMVELLLLHIHRVAVSSMSATDRQSEIRWAIATAGF